VARSEARAKGGAQRTPEGSVRLPGLALRPNRPRT
jgi:hypothetical protein